MRSRDRENFFLKEIPVISAFFVLWNKGCLKMNCELQFAIWESGKCNVKLKDWEMLDFGSQIFKTRKQVQLVDQKIALDNGFLARVTFLSGL